MKSTQAPERTESATPPASIPPSRFPRPVLRAKLFGPRAGGREAPPLPRNGAGTRPRQNCTGTGPPATPALRAGRVVGCCVRGWVPELPLRSALHGFRRDRAFVPDRAPPHTLLTLGPLDHRPQLLFPYVLVCKKANCKFSLTPSSALLLFAAPYQSLGSSALEGFPWRLLKPR